VDASIESAEVVICDKGNCAGAEFTSASVLCNNKDNAAVVATCEGASFQDSLIHCVAGACQNADFNKVDVACYTGRRDENDNACDGASFSQSTVACYNDGCDNAQFTASFGIRRDGVPTNNSFTKSHLVYFSYLHHFPLITGQRGNL